MAGIIGAAAAATLGMWFTAKKRREIALREEEDRAAEVIRAFSPELQRIAGETGAARGT